MKATLYIETTIPSYLVSRPSRDLIVAAHQEITREWWLKRKTDFSIVASQFVIDEIGAGDVSLAQERLRLLSDIPLLEVTGDVADLASVFVEQRLVPRKSATDAAHIAVATVHHVNFLMTWNCAHLANATIVTKIREACRSEGYECPVICTPEELMEG